MSLFLHEQSAEQAMHMRLAEAWQTFVRSVNVAAVDALSMPAADPFQLLCHLYSNRLTAHKHSVCPSWGVPRQSALLEGSVRAAQYHTAHAVPSGNPVARSCAQALAHSHAR